jgi:hypothetical protein
MNEIHCQYRALHEIVTKLTLLLLTCKINLFIMNLNLKNHLKTKMHDSTVKLLEMVDIEQRKSDYWF